MSDDLTTFGVTNQDVESTVVDIYNKKFVNTYGVIDSVELEQSDYTPNVTHVTHKGILIGELILCDDGKVYIIPVKPRITPLQVKITEE